MDQILVVDDEKPIRDIMKRYLTKLKFKVFLAKDGKTALEQFHSHRPLIVILDLNMPVMDGIEFLRALEPELLTAHYIIVMTGFGNDAEIETCFNLGVQSFLRKPVNLFELQGNIKRCLDMHKAVSEVKQLNQRLLMRQQDIPNFIWECDENFCLTYVDDSIAQILGKAPEDALGKPIFDLLMEEEIGRFHFKFAKDGELNFKEKTRSFTLNFKNENGDAQPMQICANGIKSDSNQVTGMVGICRDMRLISKLVHDTLATDERMRIRINSEFQLIYVDDDVRRYLADPPGEGASNPDFIQFLDDPSLERMLSFSFEQKEDIPFPIELRLVNEKEEEHIFSVQLAYCSEGPYLEGKLIPISAGDQLNMISENVGIQKRTLEDQADTLKKAVVLDDDIKQSIWKDAWNLSAETLSLIKSLESYAFPIEGIFSMEEYSRFFLNRNMQVLYENLRLLGNKIHGLKGTCGFLMPEAKQLCHKMEDITRPLSEQKLVLSRELQQLLKQFIFHIQEILEQYQADPELPLTISNWIESIDQALKRADAYIDDQRNSFVEFIADRCADKGEVRRRKNEEYMSVSQHGYELLYEQVKELYYSLSENLADEQSIQAGSLYNQFMQTHQQIKKVPLDLSRYERLIPNIAKEYHKEADLIIEDQQVKADQEFWNAVHEILNHVLKNAVIHGLELPEERKKAGKESTGRIMIKLSEDALHINLSVSDDGRGIDVEKVAAKALSNKVITPEQLELMSEQEIMELLFIQGISTADSVDDNAGRGVGMNAVQEAMLHFQGSCRIDTKPARGCSWNFSFAKSNVSLPCIIVEIGDVCIAIPEDNVESFVDYREQHCVMIKQNPAYKYNGGAVPLVDAKNIFEITEESETDNKGSQLIILKNHKERSGMIIDDILHHAVLPILPLPKIYRQVPIYLGMTLFNNIPVQVIDVKNLI